LDVPHHPNWRGRIEDENPAEAAKATLALPTGIKNEMMKLPFIASTRWTPEEDDRLHRLAKEGRSAAVIAERMKRSVESIKSRAHGLGISLKRNAQRK
jgi:hypothetical protein